MKGRLLVVVAVLGAAFFAAARFAPKDEPDPSRTGLHAAHVTYTQRWNREGTTPAISPPSAFLVKSNLGYEVRVDRGFLVDTSATLVDCLGAGGDVWEKSARRSMLDALRFEGVAYAGHTQTNDASMVARASVSDLTTANGDTLFGESHFAETRYCRFHFLVAGGAPPSAYTATFPDLDTSRANLYVRGAWRPSGESEFRPFELRSKSADAVLVDLPELIEGPMNGTHVAVVIERRLGAMFDDLELSTMLSPPSPPSPPSGSIGVQRGLDALAKGVLRNLNHRARVRLTTSP